MALSAADRIRNYIQPQTTAAANTAPTNQPQQNDYFENAEALQQRQLASQMMCMEVQNKSSQIALQFQTLSAIEAKKNEINSAIINKIAH